MAVRFLPPPEEGAPAGGQDRSDLAEVIELRSLIRGLKWGSDLESGGEDEPLENGRPAAALEAADAPGIEGESGAEHAPRPVVRFPRALEFESITEVKPGSGSSGGGTAEADDGEGDDSEDAGLSAKEDGVRLLARKARSSGELRAELLALGHGAHTIDDVIDEFERSCYLDDLGLARAVTEKLRDAKRASRTQIRMKLRDRRLPDDVIEEALGELDSDEEFDLLRQAAGDRARKLAGLDMQTAERRLLGFLARRGWSGEPAMRAAREALAGSSGSGPGRAGSSRSGGRGKPSGGVRFS